MGKNTLLCCLLLSGAVTCQDEEQLVDVKTFLGVVQGTKVETESGSPIYKFLGIPYAQPPIEELRFMPPRPVRSWEKLVATEEGPVCPQMDPFGALGFRGEEDCLYLNIYTPSIVATRNTFALKPVMVWIHGGGFITGSGNALFYDPSLIVEKDVVVVSINYRLGALGFMTFGNDKVGGNMGLKDQTMALKWVRNNIRYFGGDPNQVTIFGQSAGGMSVHAHVLSPMSKGLVSRAIAQSGTMLYKFFETMGSREERNAVKSAHLFDCSSLDLDADMLKCLQEVPVQSLIEKTSFKFSDISGPKAGSSPKLNWGPVVDNYCSDPFMPMQPLESLKTGTHNQIPFMTGTVKDEGALMVIPMLGKLEETKENWKTMGPLLLSLTKTSNISEIDEDKKVTAAIIQQFYTGGEFTEDNKQGIIDMFTDAIFLSPDQKTVSLMSRGSVPVYNYQLTYRGSNSLAVVYGGDVGDDYGVVHGDDIQYLFKSAFIIKEDQSEDDLTMRDLMITYWTNFARYGNPSPFRRSGVPHWNPVKPGLMNYMDLTPKPQMKEDLAAEEMLFWQRMIWSVREKDINRRLMLKKISNLY